jgi:type II secretory pathway component PulC
MEYQVTRARLDAALDWMLQAHNHGEHFVPHERGGTVVGVKVYGIHPDYLPGHLGIKNGDMIMDVNGFSLSALDTALRARDECRRSRELTINFERRNIPMKLSVHVTERWSP